MIETILINFINFLFGIGIGVTLTVIMIDNLPPYN